MENFYQVVRNQEGFVEKLAFNKKLFYRKQNLEKWITGEDYCPVGYSINKDQRGKIFL